MKLITLLLTAVLCLHVWAQNNTHETSGQVYLTRSLNGYSLVVEKKSLTNEDVALLSRGTKHLPITNAVKHSLFLIRGNEKKELWFAVEGHYDALEIQLPIQALEVSASPKDEIYLVFKMGSSTRITQLDLVGKRVSDSEVYRDVDAFNIKIDAAKLEVNAKGQVTVTLKWPNGQRSFIKNEAGKWVTSTGLVDSQKTQVVEAPLVIAPFVSSDEQSYWNYDKPRPGVKVEGDGIYISHRPLPPAATQAEDDAEAQGQGKAPAYEYRFAAHQITPGVEMFSRVMWNLRVENPARTPVDFFVYDATFDRVADTMVVLFRLNGVLRANLLRGPDNGLAWADTKLNLTPEEISHLAKARIEGGPNEDSVRLILEVKDAPILVFAFRGKKWVKLV